MFSKLCNKSLNYVTRSKTVRILDGNAAVAHVAYGLADNVFMFPITPSTHVVEEISEMSAKKELNVFGNNTKVSQLESELGVAAAIHGALQGGILSSTATTSQGLLLMLPSFYKFVGEALPAVFHVPCRAVGSPYQSLYPDHMDAYSMEITGVGMIASSSVQEVHDMAVISHLTAIETSLPYIHFYDGFRTSNEFSKIELLDYDEILTLVEWDAVSRFHQRALNPENPHGIGGGQFRDVVYLTAEAENCNFLNAPGICQNVMDRFAALTGRQYHIFDYVGHEEPEKVIVIMASAAKTVQETVEYLVDKYDEKVGMIVPRMIRPFNAEHFLKALPKSVKDITVMDRIKVKGRSADPLYHDVLTTIYESKTPANVYAGRYGIAGREFTPKDIEAIFENMEKEEPKNHFICGIIDDVYHNDLRPLEKSRVNMEEIQEGVHQCMFWGLGGDGTIGANQQAAEILGMKTDLNCQVYFDFDGKKTGGMTCTHMRLSKDEIKSEYFIPRGEVDYLACHVSGYVEKFDIPRYARKNGTFVLNAPWLTPEAMDEALPKEWKRQIAEKDLKLYAIDAQDIASSLGLGGRINMIMQTVFFYLSNILPIDEAIELLKTSITEAFMKKGEKIVEMNKNAVEKTLENLVEIKYDKEAWLNAETGYESSVERYTYKPRTNSTKEEQELMERTLYVVKKDRSLEGMDIKISEAVDFVNGHFPMDTSKYEKRGTSVEYPFWSAEKCIGCNQCSFVCPHAAIRPYLLNESEIDELREFESEESTFTFREEPVSKKKQEYQFRIQVSPYDCLGCGMCVTACPVEALELKSINRFPKARDSEAKYWEYLVDKTLNDEEFWRRGYNEEKYKKFNIQGSQFRFPYIEFPDSCAGCAETSYMRLLTQLYGDRMVVSNATGCSLVAMGFGPSYPLQKDFYREGPAYGNSLFEDGAEFAFGMFAGARRRRDNLRTRVQAYLKNPVSDYAELNELLNVWEENYQDGEMSKGLSKEIKAALEKVGDENELIRYMKEDSHLFLKQSNWLVGGDGWAYDINFQGLIHTIQQNEDFNVFIFDNQMYSNTGGQQSKASPIGGIAKLAPAGKKTAQMDLGRIIMGLDNVYCASVAMGGDQKQLVKAIKEAEEYEGTSVIIGYCPCIGHGHVHGLGKNTLEAQKLGVESGFWPLYTFHPDHGFTLYSKNIDPEKLELIFEKELRFNQMKISDDEEKHELLGKLKDYVKTKSEYYNWFQDIKGDMIFHNNGKK